MEDCKILWFSPSLHRSLCKKANVSLSLSLSLLLRSTEEAKSRTQKWLSQNSKPRKTDREGRISISGRDTEREREKERQRQTDRQTNRKRGSPWAFVTPFPLLCFSFPFTSTNSLVNRHSYHCSFSPLPACASHYSFCKTLLSFPQNISVYF